MRLAVVAHDGTRQGHGLRARADRLGARAPPGSFRARRRWTTARPASRSSRPRLARAKEGDREALRFLYLRYADNVYGYVR